MDHAAEFVCLQFAEEGCVPKPIAVLLLDHRSDKVYLRSREDFSAIAPPEDAMILRLMLAQLADDATANSGSAILEDLESRLSNSMRLTRRTAIEIHDLSTTLDALYARHVSSMA